MIRIADYFFAIAAMLWIGALWAIGTIAAPTLFAQLSDRALAGALAGRMFAIVAWLGIGCAAYMLIYLFAREGLRTLKSAVFWLVLLMLLFLLAGHFGVGSILAQLRAESLPREMMEGVLRNRFNTWHGIASVLYLIECVLGVALATQLYAKR